MLEQEISPQTTSTSSKEYEDFEIKIATLLAEERAEEARTMLDNFLHTSAENSHSLHRTMALILRGEVELFLGEPTRAASFLEAAEKSIDRLSFDIDIQLRILHARAEATELANRKSEARALWEKAAQLAKEHKCPRRAAIALHNQALLLFEETQFEQAEICLFDAIDLAQDLLGENDQLVPSLLESTGSLYWKAGYPDSAEKMYRYAIDFAYNSKNITAEAALRIQGNFAASLYENDQIEEAVAEFVAFVDQIKKQPLETQQQLSTCLENAELIATELNNEELLQALNSTAEKN